MYSALETLYEKYKIYELKPGAQTDALGDVYEELVRQAFLKQEVVDKFNHCIAPLTIEEEIVHAVCTDHEIEFIESVELLGVPKTDAGGEPKTDVCVLINGNTYIKLTIKQSRAAQVTVAEFSVDSIKNKVGIKDPKIISLMEKHQRDASAKNFSPEERECLTKGMLEHRRALVRWTYSGSTEDSEDLRVANYSINFLIDGPTKELINFVTHSIDSLVNKTLQLSRGFGTGLSWTYATGTKGKKIQFKGSTFTL